MTPYLFDRLHALASRIARRPLGVFVDFDGVLAPFVPNPEQARVNPACRDALTLLATRIRLVSVVSGRRAEQLRRLVGVDRLVYSGNHGLERWENGSLRIHPVAAAAQEGVAQVCREVLRVAAEHNVYVEDKGPLVGFHYRPAPDREEARRALLRELEPRCRERGLTLYQGIALIEVRPPMPVSKGTTVRELAIERQLGAAFYLGDDRTDLDAFAALRALAQEGRIVAVRVAVAHGETPQEVLDAADYVVRDTSDVARLLRWLASGEA